MTTEGLPAAADPIPRRPGTWRVATWNLWGHFGDEPEGRLQRIEATLRGLDADVVALQEVYSDQAAGDDAVRLGEGLGYHLVRLLPDPDRATAMIGNALLSRWPVVEQGGQPLPNLLGTPGHRQGLWAVLAAPFGRLPVIATHLAYRFDESAVRQQQVRALLALADRLRSDKAGDPPVILCGDLNAVPDSDELRLLTGRSEAPVPGLVFNDCWPQVRPDAGHTWVRRNPYLRNSVWPERRLDYVLVSWPRPAPLGNPVEAFLVGDGPIDGLWASDHLGVAVDFRTGEAELS
jgi:endonuclease/exonuclease/phosphatase family metal-dependent hydrolase